VLKEQFTLEEVLPLQPRYNIAPTQQVAAVRHGQQGREMVLLRWGLIPSWARDPSIGNRLLNARAETITEKPSFRSALKHRRCLIVADGFFEWQSIQGKKQPRYCRLRDGKPFAFAGLWEHWSLGENEPVQSCTIITTEANELVRPLHERMPVILPPDAYQPWLDTAGQGVEQVLSLLRAYSSKDMIAYPVSMRVNSPRHDDPGCIEQVA
jgi:putative SOS response-associated peptidase YedK